MLAETCTTRGSRSRAKASISRKAPRAAKPTPSSRVYGGIKRHDPPDGGQRAAAVANARRTVSAAAFQGGPR